MPKLLILIKVKMQQAGRSLAAGRDVNRVDALFNTDSFRGIRVCAKVMFGTFVVHQIHSADCPVKRMAINGLDQLEHKCLDLSNRPSAKLLPLFHSVCHVNEWRSINRPRRIVLG